MKKGLSKMKNLFMAVLSTFILSFIFVFGFFIFNKIFIQSNFSYIENAIGAFMGAFFAFLFIRLSDIFRKIYEREKRHYNTLVKLEHICNDYLNIISDNIFIIKDFIKCAENSFEKNVRMIYFNRLHPFPINKEIILDLSNIDLINEVFSFWVGINKINSSLDATNRFYTEIKEAFIQKLIDGETYKANIKILITKLTELKKFLLDLKKEDKRIAVIARILLKKKPLLTRFMHFLSKKHLTDKEREMIPKEMEKLESEIAEVKKKSQERIEKILSRKN